MEYLIKSDKGYLVGFDGVTGEAKWGVEGHANKYAGEFCSDSVLERVIAQGNYCTKQVFKPKTKYEKWAELIASMYSIDPGKFDMSNFSTCVVGHMVRMGWIQDTKYDHVAQYLEIPLEHARQLMNSICNRSCSLMDMIKKYNLYVGRGFNL